VKQRAIVIGAGINGLVASNYLQRNGFEVTLLERKPVVGGACACEQYSFEGKPYDYPSGATVLGFMQDFVFSETGLSKRLSVHAPQHPAVIWFESLRQPCLIYDDVEQLKKEVKQKWNETGNVEGFLTDLERVRSFLIQGYRQAKVPTLETAASHLGDDLAQLWIAGSARRLMNHYFSSEFMKVYCSLDVTESGPVSIDEPYSAFTIPLMASGSIFGGKWGFVRGGLWQLTETLAGINTELGVSLITGARVLNASTEEMTVTYEKDGAVKNLKADYVIFATDPVSAATLLGQESLLGDVNKKKSLGTSGKVVLLFRKPIVWKDRTGHEDFDSCFKFIMSVDSLDQLEATTQAVVDGKEDFRPGYFELYCEGAGMRRLGLERGYDSLTVFSKNLSFSKSGEELPHVKEQIAALVLSRIENGEDLFGSVLLTPKDLQEKFFFPQGNIDHIELSDGQTFFTRNFSANPAGSFYQFGDDERVRYCAAGSYPCGSIAGTPGYMCAQELILSVVAPRAAL
jgi:phytoene dehydrogenase-like protein